jgi:hypothetical protein
MNVVRIIKMVLRKYVSWMKVIHGERNNFRFANGIVVERVKITGLKPSCNYSIYTPSDVSIFGNNHGGSIEIKNVETWITIYARCHCGMSECAAKITVYYI